MKKIIGLVIGMVLSFVFCLNAQIIAFPGAEGGDMYTTGGRRGAVYYVNTLEDNEIGDSQTKEGSAIVDTDGDGIPDGWLERNHPRKKAEDLNEEGYTYLECYLNSLVQHITINQI